MATPRGSIIRLLEAHPWTPPKTLVDARHFHSTLAPLTDTARHLAGWDRVAKLVPLRLDTFLAHWPQPPDAENLEDFLADVRPLCRHDIPRLRRTLMWAPRELPEQRTPRLGVPSLHTA